MRRLLPALLTSTCVAGVAVAAIALGGTAHRPTSSTHQAGRGVLPTLPGSVHIVRYQRGGSFTSCTGTSCSGGSTASPGLEFSLPPSPTAYRSTLTLSFRYRASGAGATFVVRPELFAESSGHAVTTVPASRPVLGTGGRAQTMTLVFRTGPLSGGTRYGFGVTPDIAHMLRTARIAVSSVVYTLDAWLP
jgi:hypothetical protein